MNIIVILVAGALLGWIASLLMRAGSQQVIRLNVVVGVIGALLAGFMITPLIGGSPITTGNVDLRSLVVSCLGALVLLAIADLARRGTDPVNP